MMKATAKHCIIHNGTLYRTGEKIELTAEELEAMRKDGIELTVLDEGKAEKAEPARKTAARKTK